MGNHLRKNSAASSENNEQTPSIVQLNADDVEIIKRTWKIPSANVGLLLLMLAVNWICMIYEYEAII